VEGGIDMTAKEAERDKRKGRRGKRKLSIL
jgi:hypothetical protein